MSEKSGAGRLPSRRGLAAREAETVARESNPRYYALIEAFRALTGVPMVLSAPPPPRGSKTSRLGSFSGTA